MQAARAWLAARCPEEWSPAGQWVRVLEARVQELEQELANRPAGVGTRTDLVVVYPDVRRR